MAGKPSMIVIATVGTGSSVDLYTVPSGLRAVIKKITVANKNSASSSDLYGVCIGTYGVGFIIPSHLLQGSVMPDQLYGPYTLEAGTKISWQGTTNCIITIDAELSVA